MGSSRGDFLGLSLLVEEPSPQQPPPGVPHSLPTSRMALKKAGAAAVRMSKRDFSSSNAIFSKEMMFSTFAASTIAFSPTSTAALASEAPNVSPANATPSRAWPMISEISLHT